MTKKVMDESAAREISSQVSDVASVAPQKSGELR
jgi:hypothetical protein